MTNDKIVSFNDTATFNKIKNKATEIADSFLASREIKSTIVKELARRAIEHHYLMILASKYHTAGYTFDTFDTDEIKEFESYWTWIGFPSDALVRAVLSLKVGDSLDKELCEFLNENKIPYG